MVVFGFDDAAAADVKLGMEVPTDDSDCSCETVHGVC